MNAAPASPPAASPALALYRGLVSALGPFAGLWLGARARDGKEDPARLGERFGRAPAPRPDGRLVWLHGASVGETGVALQVHAALAAADPALNFLFTSGTRTSAELFARRAPARARHVFVPLDRPDAVRRFLDHWRPDLGVFVESEAWPNLILEARARGVKLALVNARMSPATLKRWRGWARAARRVFGAFDLALAADARTAQALAEFRAAPAPTVGNLKLAAPPPPVDPEELARLKAAIGARPVWLAASTHEGEEELLLAAHAALRADRPDALLILAPRHPERGAEIAALAGGAPRRSAGAAIGAGAVYVADTMGELGLLYSVAPVAFIAGSLTPKLKGHNPIEPAKLGCAILAGPYVESFEDVYEDIFASGGALRACTPQEIAGAVELIWADDGARARLVRGAGFVAQRGGAALEAAAARLLALLAPEARAIRPADASA